MNQNRPMLKVLNVFLLLVLAMLPLAQPNSARAQTPPPQPAAAEDDSQPVMIKDIYTADLSSNPSNFFDYGDKLIFTASTPENREGLWVSDGTFSGTKMVKAISGSTNFTLFDGKVFFSTYQGLWATDGTEDGTSIMFERNSSDCDYDGISTLLPHDDWLFFFCGQSLMSYDRVTHTVNNFVSGGPLSVSTHGMAWMNGKLYFSATDGETGYELWSLDPQTKQLALIKDMCADICPGSIESDPGSWPRGLTVSNNHVFFVAIDESHGYELWSSDGTEAGTQIVKDIYPGISNGLLSDLNLTSDLTAVAGWLYFIAKDGVHGSELWRSDGTAVNTTLVADIFPGEGSSNIQYLTVQESFVQPTLFFSARDALPGAGHGVELWSVGVTPAGVSYSTILLEIAPGPASAWPEYITVMGMEIYFAAQDTPGNIELWSSLNHPATTTQAVDILAGPDGSAPMNITVWNGNLVFSAIDPVNGREPWISDGTQQWTEMIANIAGGVDEVGSNPSTGLQTNVGGRHIRYFTARDALHGYELWRTDGTTDGTWLVKDVYPGPQSGLEFCSREMAELNGFTYFCAFDPNYGGTLWRTDGTTAGTKQFKVTAPGEMYAYPHNFTVVGSRLFFAGYDRQHGEELWVSDGTANGTHLLKDLVPGPDFSYPFGFTALGNKLIFATSTNYDSPYTFRLWRSDGTTNGTVPFFGPYQESDGYDGHAVLQNKLVAGGKLYFSMNIDDPTGNRDGNRLWVTDGTQAGTSVIGSTNTQIPYVPETLALVGTNLYFSADDFLSSSRTLWKLPLGSMKATKVVYYFYDPPRYIDSLNGKDLIGLIGYSSGENSEWVTINESFGVIQSICTNCYPHLITDISKWWGKIYFGANEYPTGLWRTDATEAGTQEIMNPVTASSFRSAGEFLSTPYAFYFSADDRVHGNEPWMISGALDDNTVYLPLLRR